MPLYEQNSEHFIVKLLNKDAKPQNLDKIFNTVDKIRDELAEMQLTVFNEVKAARDLENNRRVRKIRTTLQYALGDYVMVSTAGTKTTQNKLNLELVRTISNR